MRVFLFVCLMILLVSTISSVGFCDEATSSQASKQTKESKRNQKLLQYLKESHDTEIHESSLYVDFAKKADEEGYGQVASLFRALSEAEQIHASNKAVLIEQLGGTLEPTTHESFLGTTVENIDWALSAEQLEKEAMYEDYAKQARKYRNDKVAQTFEFCMASEPWHVHILNQARNDLEDYTGVNIDFHVCSTCGNTVRSLSFEQCRVCELPKESYLTVR